MKCFVRSWSEYKCLEVHIRLKCSPQSFSSFSEAIIWSELWLGYCLFELGSLAISSGFDPALTVSCSRIVSILLNLHFPSYLLSETTHFEVHQLVAVGFALLISATQSEERASIKFPLSPVDLSWPNPVGFLAEYWVSGDYLDLSMFRLFHFIGLAPIEVLCSNISTLIVCYIKLLKIYI